MPDSSDDELTMKERRELLSLRVTIASVLLSFGASIFFLTFGTLFYILTDRYPGYFGDLSSLAVGFIILGIGSIIIFLRRFSRYQTKRKLEGRTANIDWRSIIKPAILFIAVNALLIFALSVFWPIIAQPTLVKREEAILGIAYIMAIGFYFSVLPILMALWFKITPFFASLWVRIHILFMGMARKLKKRIVETDKKIHRIFIHDMAQSLSMNMILKRSILGISMSILLITQIVNQVSVVEIINFIIKRLNLDVPLLVEDTYIEQITSSQYGNTYFVLYCAMFVGITIIPLLLSQFAFVWLLPPTWLLDDAGVVFYRHTLKIRKAPVLKSIGA
ncbi:MAG: hypothetical protein ACTSRA_19195 [Promethearchaeota archaeon]